MAVIHWWLLPIEPAEIGEFDSRAISFYQSGSSSVWSTDEAGRSVLEDYYDLVPGERYLYPEMEWVTSASLEYYETH